MLSIGLALLTLAGAFWWGLDRYLELQSYADDWDDAAALAGNDEV